jgi:glycosidase
MPRRVALLLTLLALAACATPAAQAPAATPAEVGATATALPRPTDLPTASPAPSATAAPALPTPPPQITAAPAVAAAPPQPGWWDGAVCYEVFVRSFADSDGDGIGDLNGLAAKLDYINDGNPATTSDLGANCIWLMPIMQAASYHGYDVTDYYTVEHDYGSNDDFKRLVAEADKRGIKIILDLVLNHTSSQHPWFQAALHNPGSPYRDWYLWAQAKPAYKGPFGGEAWHRSPVANEYYYGMFWSEMPDLNYRNPAVTAEAEQISDFWLKEMGAAGFRMDAVKHLIEHQAAQADTVETHNWLRDYRSYLQRSDPGSFTIGEIFDSNPSNLGPYYPDQLDSYFEFEVARQIRGAAKLGLARPYLQAVSQAYQKLPYQRWAPFLTNPDQNRVMSELGDDPAKAKLAALALLTLPGMPFVYYGEEIGMLGVKPDERLRTPMQWDASPGFGFTSGRPWQALQADAATKNVAAQSADPGSLLNAYRRLIGLHTTTSALAKGDFTPLSADNSGVAAFIRRQGDSAVLVLINFDKAAAAGVGLALATSDLPPGAYRLTPLYGAPGTEPAPLRIDAGGSVLGYRPMAEIPPQTGYIFQLTP